MAQPEPVIQPIGSDLSRHETSSLMVLIVDDDPTSRTILAGVLSHAGHVVLVASSAEEGLALFHEHQPHLVLMDVVLPGVSGCFAMNLMKEARAPHWLPVVLVSVRDTDQDVLAGLRAGADDYLTKPVKIDHVLAKVRNISRSLALQAQLSHSLGFARAIMDHIAEALLCCDASGLVQRSNRAAEQLFGYDAGELEGVDLSTLLPDSLPSCFPGQGAPSHFFGTGQRKDGALFSIESKQTAVTIDERPLAVITLRDVTEQLREERRLLNDAAALREYKRTEEHENGLARQMLDRFQKRGPGTERVRSFTEAATGFSGDVVAANRSPSGKLFTMLADATGHGLTAAISLVPALSVLHGMVARDRSLSELAAELNTKLLELLPTGRFMAAALVCIDERERWGEIWVGGVPPVLMVDSKGTVTQRFESTHFAFGVCSTDPSTLETTRFSWNETQQLVLASDGVTEAEAPCGDHFGEEGLLRALRQAEPEQRLERMTQALREHLGGFPCSDDASIAVVELPGAPG
jgi:PAS domain S-box-containing protein